MSKKNSIVFAVAMIILAVVGLLIYLKNQSSADINQTILSPEPVVSEIVFEDGGFEQSQPPALSNKWQSDGASEQKWIAQTEIVKEGKIAAQIKNVKENSYSFIKRALSLTRPAEISFNWKVSSEEGIGKFQKTPTIPQGSKLIGGDFLFFYAANVGPDSPEFSQNLNQTVREQKSLENIKNYIQNRNDPGNHWCLKITSGNLVNINLANVKCLSGEKDWQNQTVKLDPGQYILYWGYSKDADQYEGWNYWFAPPEIKDAAWLDDVKLKELPFVISGIVPIEAEQGRLRPQMKIEEDQTASGGKYIWVPKGTVKNKNQAGGWVQYDFEIAEAGAYYFQALAQTGGSKSNSFYVSLDDSSNKAWKVNYKGEWHWQKIDPIWKVNLAKGRHSLKISHREDGTKLDKILITNDSKYKP